MPIRFFYFDLGNVLMNFCHERAVRQMAAVAGVGEELVRRVVFTDGLQWEYEEGAVTSDGFYEAFCAATGSRPDRGALLRANGDIFEVNVPFCGVVTAVQLAGYRTGVLSNTCAAHWDHCVSGRYSFFPGAFEVFALSYEMQAMKPRPEAYAAAIRLAGVPADEILFVDDRPDNVAGAQAAGIDTLLYTTPAAYVAELRRRGVRVNY